MPLLMWAILTGTNLSNTAPGLTYYTYLVVQCMQYCRVSNNRLLCTLNFIGSSYAFSFSLANPGDQATWQNFDSYYVFARPFFVPSDDANAAQIRVRSVRPSNIDETTAVPVRVRGQIRNFSGIQYCRVEFDVVVTQRLP